MDTAVTLDRHPDRQPTVILPVRLPVILMSSPVQTACPGRAPFLTEQRLASGHAAPHGAPPGRRGPVHRSGLEAEGKIEGTGTWPVRKRVCTWGWRGTRRSAAPCRDTCKRFASAREITCSIRAAAIGLDDAGP